MWTGGEQTRGPQGIRGLPCEQVNKHHLKEFKLCSVNRKLTNSIRFQGGKGLPCEQKIDRQCQTTWSFQFDQEVDHQHQTPRSERFPEWTESLGVTTLVSKLPSVEKNDFSHPLPEKIWVKALLIWIWARVLSRSHAHLLLKRTAEDENSGSDLFHRGGNCPCFSWISLVLHPSFQRNFIFFPVEVTHRSSLIWISMWKKYS